MIAESLGIKNLGYASGAQGRLSHPLWWLPISHYSYCVIILLLGSCFKAILGIPY